MLRISRHGVLSLLLSATSVVSPLLAATFTVNSTSDVGDNNAGDGVCNDGSGNCTLRAAIEEANAFVGTDNIQFSIAGVGPHTFTPGSAFPTITDPVIIDGTTEPDYTITPVVELNGTSAGASYGLWITAGSSTVKGLAINRFGIHGIFLQTNGNNLIQGNFLGTSANGTADLGNTSNGVEIQSPSNTIGGTSAADRNIISGNDAQGIRIITSGATGNVVRGNYIGTDVTGTVDLGNTVDGLQINSSATGNTIGGSNAGAGNVISGNNNIGIKIVTSGNTIQGNHIGTNAAGTASLGNTFHGIEISNVSNNTIGGTAAGSRNLISGNGTFGIYIIGTSASGNTILGNYIGTDVTGTGDLGNTSEGVHIRDASNNTVGGTTATARNIISGNNSFGVGIFTFGAVPTGNIVAGNYIGTDVNGATAIGNSQAGVSITGANNTVGGTTAGAGNLISGNSQEGVEIFTSDATGNKVEGNLIGTNATGTSALANGFHGVIIRDASNNTVGGTTSGARNVISGNSQEGVRIQESSASTTGNRVEGNYIGTDITGTADVGNVLDGVVVLGGATANTIGGTATGAGNIISGNDLRGVAIFTATSLGNPVLGNSIHSNTDLGIDLNGDGITTNDAGDADTGVNNLQNFPILTGPPPGGTNATGTLNSTASTTFRIEFFASTSCESEGYGEGETYLDFTNVTTDGGGNATISYTLGTPLPSGKFVTATATDPSNNTSEFSLCGPIPTVSSISPVSGKVGDSVTLTGANFSTTPTNNVVWFGGGEATVTSASTTSLTVSVPPGVRFGPVRVTVNNRTAESDDFFLPTFAGEYPTIDASTLAAKVDVTTGTGAYYPVLADLDGDGKSDLAVANWGAATLSVFRNISTSGTLDGSSFAAKLDLTTGTTPYHADVGDVDGDGELELIVTNNGSGTVSVFHNISTVGSLLFAAKVDFSSGTVPRGVSTGDVDGDGKLDLAIGHDNPTNLVSVLRNTSVSGTIDGSSFSAKVDFTPQVVPSDVALGDVDGDGKPEMVVTNGAGASQSISVFHNTSTPGVIDASTFAAQVAFSTGSNPYEVVLGDVDGDGKLDVVAASYALSNSISVFHNTSTPGTINGSSLAATVDFNVGGDPYSVALGDIDGDGKLDMAASDFASDKASLFRNTSTMGTIDANSFATGIQFATGSGPLGVALGDIDGDEKPDIVVANSSAPTVSLYHNLIPNTPLPTISVFTPVSGHVGKTITINGTNFDATAANTTIYLGATKANPTTATSTSLTVDVPVGATFSPITVIRGNRLVESGQYFLPTFSSSSPSIDVSTFASKLDFATGAGPYSDVAIGDLDGDGKPDLAVPNFNARTVSVFRNTSSSGAISLAGKVDFTAGTAPWGVDLGDTDGDGKLDLVATSRSSTIASIFRNTSTSGSISFATKVDLTTDTNPEGVSVGDLDGDGKLDIAVADKGTDRLSVFRNVSNPGGAAFEAKVDFIPSAGPEDVAIADVDGDGKADLIASHSTSSIVSVFRNIGSPGTIDGSFFATKVDLTAGSAAFGMSLGDIDGDTKLDIAVANNGTNTISVFRNTGSSGSVSFAAKQDFTAGTAAASVAMGDLDGDGKLDLAATSFSSNTVSLFRNTATSGAIDANSLAAKVDLTTGTSPSGVSIADLDGDGRTDIAVANFASNTMSVFRNQSTLKTTGHVGAAIVGAGSEIQLFSIGLTSFGTFTLNSIDLTISDLDAATGLITNDLDLVLYRSSDETFDSGDTQIGLQSSVNIGTATTVAPTATETPTNHTFYIITARMNTVVDEEGHAFKMGFALNGVSTSAGNEGAAITASESNKVTFEVVADHWEFTSQPANTTHLELFSPQPFLEARDQHGNRDKDFNGTVALTLSPAGTLSHSDFAAADGRVVIDSLTVSGAGDGRTLTATGLGLTGTSASFDVAKADATVTLNNLDAKSDGNPKVGGATTDPPGLDVIFTHNAFGMPLASPPIDPGAYGVTATVNDPNYQGSATGTLTIFLAEPPRAVFSASTLQGNPPLTVTFSDQSSGPVETWFLEPKADDNRVYEDRNQDVTVTYSTPGTHSVFLTVRGVGITHQSSLDIIVNGPPDLANIADATANEDETLELDLSAIDAESGTWTLAGADQTLVSASSIQGNKIEFTPVPHANGSDVVTITRTNVHGLSTAQDVTLTWAPVDDAPTIVDLASRYSAEEDNPIHVGAVENVTDLDSDVTTLLWSASGFDGVLVGTATASNNGVDFAPVANAFGETQATIVVTDPATGATATQEVTLVWTRVNDAPSMPVVGFPADGMQDTPLAPLFSWSARDVDFDALVFDLFLGPTGSTLEQVASRQDAASYSSSELSPGTPYTWKVVAHDPSDATADATFVFTTEADLRAPLVSNVGAAPTERSVTFDWGTDEPATSSLKLTVEDGGPATVNPNPAQLDPSKVEISGSDLVREHQLTAEDLRAGIWFRYEIRSTDALGNESEAYAGRVLTLSAPDGTAPLFLVDPYIEGTTTESAVVLWRTDELSDSRVRFVRLAASKSTAATQESVSEVVVGELTEEHLVPLDGLEAGTEYSFEAQSADVAGNLSAVRSGSFTTGVEADVTAPGFTAGPAATAITNTSAFIALEADELVTLQIRFDSDEDVSDGRLVGGTQTRAEHRIQLLELEPSTRYYFQVLIRDASGNETRSEQRDFETRAAPDLVSAGILAGPAIEGLTDQSAVLVLLADEPVRVQLLVSTDPELDGALLEESGELQMSHTLQLTNLEADTDYFYEVLMRDGANNESRARQGSFHTLSEGQHLPPEIVELFAEGVGFERATVIWRTSEPTTGSLRFQLDAAAEGGHITIAEPAKRQRVQMTQLQPDSKYGVTVFALDAQGNGVERSFSLRTLGAVDKQPPLTETGPNVLGISSVSAVVEVTYNEPVELELSYATNPELTDAETVASIQRQRPHRVELAGLEPGITYWVGLEARDQTDNSSSEPLQSFTTDTEADQTPPAFVTAPFATDLTSTFTRVRLELDEPASVELVASTAEDLSAPTHSVRSLERRQQHAIELTNLRPDTPYFFRVTAEDAGENQTVSSISRFESLSRTLQPVQLTAGPVAQRIGDRSATIFLRLDRAAEAVVTYHPLDQPADEVTESRGLAAEHNVVLSNLSPGTEYAYRVGFGVDSEASGSLRTETTADIKPPKFFGPPVVVDRKHNRVRIEWDTDEVADSEILFTPMGGANAKALANGFNPAVAAKILADNGGERVIVPADVKNHEVVLTNLTPGTRFLFESFCTDPAGNRVQWPVLDFRTPAGPDIAPPVMIGRPIVRGLSGNSFLLAFTTNEPTAATLRSADGAIHLASGNQETNHELRVVGLEPATTYELSVCAIDAGGNGPTCEQLSVTTRATDDRRAPRINTGPIVISAGAEEAVVELTTDEPTAVGVGYQAVAASGGDAAAGAVDLRTIEDPEFLTFHRVVVFGPPTGDCL